MAAYNENRVSGLYFVTYMMATFFFLANIILALVVNTYEANTSQREKEIDQTREQCLKSAFQMLDKEDMGHITKKQIMAVFLHLNEECEEIRCVGLLFGKERIRLNVETLSQHFLNNELILATFHRKRQRFCLRYLMQMVQIISCWRNFSSSEQ